jgi:DUF4097 and DUF4098 domain-containing protein YvlB
MARYVMATLTAVLVVAFGALAGCGSGSINGPVRVAAGQKMGDVATINGSVTVEDGATVGSAATVNGAVSLGANVSAQSVKTVNGEVRVGDASRVSGDVFTVNGSVILDDRADVSGKIGNINGGIRLKSAHVGGGITTVNGDIDVGSGSHVDGGIHVEKPGMSNSNRHRSRIVIGPNAMVNGGMRFEREVKLYVSDSAQISGPIEGATPEKFAGDQPPG